MEDDGPLPLLAFAFLGPSAPLLWQMQAEGLLLPDPCVPKTRVSHNLSFSRSRLEAMLDHVDLGHPTSTLVGLYKVPNSLRVWGTRCGAQMPSISVILIPSP